MMAACAWAFAALKGPGLLDSFREKLAVRDKPLRAHRVQVRMRKPSRVTAGVSA
jgi:hypothetical protein